MVIEHLMRVAFLTNTETLYGGNRSLVELIDGLRKLSVEPHVIVPKEGDLTVALASRHVPLKVLPIQNWVSNDQLREELSIQQPSRYAKRRVGAVYRLAKNLAVMPKLVRQLKIWDVDVVYTNSSVTPAGAVAAALIRRPHVWHLREFVDSPDSGLRTDWGMKLYRYFIAKADAQIAISKVLRSYYLGDSVGNGTRSAVIYNGVGTVAQFDDWKEAVARQSLPEQSVKESSKPYTFLIMGRISPSKGQATAVEALAKLVDRHPEVRLLVVGGGECAVLEALAAKLGVSGNIDYWGYTDDQYQAYFASDAVLVCSKSEGMGRVAAEAMSVCRPVIGLNRTATPEIVEDGHTGLLFDGGAGPLAACMRQFVENPSWARTLGINGWQVAREKFNAESYTERVYELLKSVACQQSR
jgi:glycosyltransferase involved in cell wall biosynthesis